MRPNLSHLSKLDQLDAIDLPEPSTVVAVRESVLDASEELEHLTTSALRNLKEILDPPVDFAFPRQVNAKLGAAQTVLNTQVRVDEGRLKRRKLDALPKLLAAIAREEGRGAAARIIEGELAQP